MRGRNPIAGLCSLCVIPAGRGNNAITHWINYLLTSPGKASMPPPYARRFLNIPRSATLLRKKATPKPSRV